jgi:hypothetical protein
MISVTIDWWYETAELGPKSRWTLFDCSCLASWHK